MNKNLDFTLYKFAEILNCLLDNGYSFQTLENFLNNPADKAVILRHDVDRAPFHSLHTAKLENSRGIKGTYYFRIVKQSNHPQVIREIASLGHEIGYHYEEMAFASQKLKFKSKKFKITNAYDLQDRKTEGLQDKVPLEKKLADIAIDSFAKNLENMRGIAPVKTICMHGSPMSRWDSRLLWKYYDYRDFGIIGEPYFDIDFDKVLYLTDTGRKWNGEKSSVRDKVSQGNFLALKEKLKNSDNIIEATSTDKLPQQIMITFHPQRWTDNPFVWISEYAVQTLKNRIKQLIFVR